MNHMKKQIAFGLAILLAMMLLAMPAAAGDKKDDGKLNINTATEKDLLTKLNWDFDQAYVDRAAKAIVKWREKNGPFKHINDLLLIPSMNGGAFLNIKNQITVGD